MSYPFLPRDATPSRQMLWSSVCPSVTSEVLSKRLNGSGWFLTHRLDYPQIILHWEFAYLQ